MPSKNNYEPDLIYLNTLRSKNFMRNKFSNIQKYIENSFCEIKIIN